MKQFGFLAILLSLWCCSPEEEDIKDTTSMYFPPISSDSWETVTPESLGWNTASIPDLYTFLESNGTRAFIILCDGRIVIEKYWGKNILNTAPFEAKSHWYWASAGKTITSFLVGIAQQDGLLNIGDKTSDYLGNNWTSMPLAKENLITIRHQLTMTTGLDYTVSNVDCTDPACLLYKADAGTQWYYHNAPYTLLEQVISNASGISYNAYTDMQLEAKTGMSGSWIVSGYNNVYWSTARDAARFGLLILNKGTWAEDDILTDEVYYNSMITTSQNLNPAYGYLWWLNGKSSIIYPGLPTSFPVPLSVNAPADLFAAMGKNGQFVEVIPGKRLVVIRMGEAPDNALVPIVFHDDMWGKLGAIIK